MKLSDFLAALTTMNMQIVLTDLDTGAEIVSMKAAGYANLDDTLENRQVMQWAVTNATTLKVTLGDTVQAVDPSNSNP